MTRVTVTTPGARQAERHPKGPPGNYHHSATLTHVADPTEAPPLCRATGFRISVTPLVRPVSELLRHLAVRRPEQIRWPHRARRTTAEPGRRVTLVLASLAALTLTACSVLVVAGTDRLRSTTYSRTSPFLAAPDPNPAPVVVPDPKTHGRGQSAGYPPSRPGSQHANPAPPVHRADPVVQAPGRGRAQHTRATRHHRPRPMPLPRPISVDPPARGGPAEPGPLPRPRDPEDGSCAALVFAMCLTPSDVPEPKLPRLTPPPPIPDLPAEPGPGHCHPGQTDPGQTGAGRLDPGRTDPGRTGAGQASTGQPEESAPLHPTPGTRSPGKRAPGTELPGVSPRQTAPPEARSPEGTSPTAEPSAPAIRIRVVVPGRPTTVAAGQVTHSHPVAAGVIGALTSAPRQRPPATAGTGPYHPRT